MHMLVHCDSSHGTQKEAEISCSDRIHRPSICVGDSRSALYGRPLLRIPDETVVSIKRRWCGDRAARRNTKLRCWRAQERKHGEARQQEHEHAAAPNPCPMYVPSSLIMHPDGPSLTHTHHLHIDIDPWMNSHPIARPRRHLVCTLQLPGRRRQ